MNEFFKSVNLMQYHVIKNLPHKMDAGEKYDWTTWVDGYWKRNLVVFLQPDVCNQSNLIMAGRSIVLACSVLHTLILI